MAEEIEQPEEQIEEWKEYTEPVAFFVNGERISWAPEEETLFAMPGTIAREIADSVEDLIMYLGEDGYIRASAEGPWLPASVKSLYTVVWAFNELYKEDLKVSGIAPTLEDMGLDG
jgi:hypothetical protein